MRIVRFDRSQAGSAPRGTTPEVLAGDGSWCLRVDAGTEEGVVLLSEGELIHIEFETENETMCRFTAVSSDRFPQLTYEQIEARVPIPWTNAVAVAVLDGAIGVRTHGAGFPGVVSNERAVRGEVIVFDDDHELPVYERPTLTALVRSTVLIATFEASIAQF
jgi:hypothetical protein